MSTYSAPGRFSDCFWKTLLMSFMRELRQSSPMIGMPTQ